MRGAHLGGVHAMADHARVAPLLRQVAHPGRHEVQHGGALRDALPVELRDPREEPFIHVRHQPRVACACTSCQGCQAALVRGYSGTSMPLWRCGAHVLTHAGPHRERVAGALQCACDG